MRTRNLFAALALVLMAYSHVWAQTGGERRAGTDTGSAPAAESPAKSPGNKNQPARNAPADKDSIAKDRPRALLSVTPEREAAVMTFVKQHHEELAELLVQLKSGNPQEYEKAVRDLFRTSERLAQIHERDLGQYELELKLWQAQSRVQLLSARVKMSTSKDLREQLRTALNDQLDARLAILKRDRERAAARVSDLDEQIARMEKNRKQMVDRQAETLAGEVNPRKPAKAPPTEKTTGT